MGKLQTKEPTMGVTVEMQIAESRIQDMLINGFEGGIGYWATIVEYKLPEGVEKPRNAYASVPLMEGGAVILTDREKVGRGGDLDADAELWTLNRESMIKGLTIMAQKYPRHFANFIDENDDAETADVFIQCSVMGDIVYG